MNVLYISPHDDTPWRRKVEQLLEGAKFHVWPDDAPADPGIIDYILCWKPEPGLLAKFTNARAIFNLGAGVDYLMNDKTLPTGVPIVRLVDPLLTAGMVEYVAHWVLHYHRGFDICARQQQENVWKEYPPANTGKRSIGFMGIGELGGASARALMNLGFKNISAWSRNKKEIDGIKSFAGMDKLPEFLGQAEIVVMLLPLTPETREILNTETISHLSDGAFVINAGRGGLVNDDALLAALDNGRIAGAALDVFATEPLPANHRYWNHPRVNVTPHIASLTVAGSAARGICNTIIAMEKGAPAPNTVNLGAGY